MFQSCAKALSVVSFELVCSTHTLRNYFQIDKDYVPGLMCIRDMDPDSKDFSAMDMPFSTPSAAGHEVKLSSRSAALNYGIRVVS